MPQGEKLEVVQHQPTEQVIPQFLPIPQSILASTEAQPSVRLDPNERRGESGEVPFPIDEPGGGETHGFEGSIPEARVSVEPGMDIDIVEENVDTGLKELMAVLRRDERLEIEEANREIMAVLNSLGADTAKYRRAVTLLLL